MATFPPACDECGFLFDTTTDHDQEFITLHVAEHKAAHGVSEKFHADAKAKLEEAYAEFAKQPDFIAQAQAAQNNYEATAYSAENNPIQPLADFVPTPVEETL
jgi:TPP-dependent trihydroxycyclohexane-1,2-dione (THcHDO) dehydratase